MHMPHIALTPPTTRFKDSTDKRRWGSKSPAQNTLTEKLKMTESNNFTHKTTD